jgi:hypothetical protein
MNKANFTCDGGNILNEVIASYSGMANPPIGLIQGLQMIRAGLRNVGQLAIDLHNREFNEIIPVIEELRSIGVIRTLGDRPTNTLINYAQK